MKRENNGYRVCRCRHRVEPPMDGVTVCRSGYQSVIRSYIHTVIPSHGRKGAVSRPQESGAVIPVYKGEVNTGLSVDRPAVPHRPKGGNNKVGFGIVGKVSTTSANSQVHKADSIAEPIRHGQTADTPQGIYEENAVIY